MNLTRRDWLAERVRAAPRRTCGPSPTGCSGRCPRRTMPCRRPGCGSTAGTRAGSLTCAAGSPWSSGASASTRSRRRRSRREQLAGSWLPEPIVRVGPARTRSTTRSWPTRSGWPCWSCSSRSRRRSGSRSCSTTCSGSRSTRSRRWWTLARGDAPARQPGSATVRAQAPEPDADLAVQRQVVDAFLAAARDGDFEALLALLDPDVVVRIDGGPDAPRRSRGRRSSGPWRSRPGEELREIGARFEPVIVNGAPGLLVRFPARALLWAFTVGEGRVAAIDLIADPAKFRGCPPPSDDPRAASRPKHVGGGPDGVIYATTASGSPGWLGRDQRPSRRANARSTNASETPTARIASGFSTPLMGTNVAPEDRVSR